MAHTNLLYYQNVSALEAEQGTGGTVTTVRPGVGWAHEQRDVRFNKKKVTYAITVNYKNTGGTSIAQSTTSETGLVLEGREAKVKLTAVSVDGYEAVPKEVKVTVSGNSSYDFLYKRYTAYTVTVHHMCEGSAITADTTVVSPQVLEEEFVNVEIVPLAMSEYSAETATIRISGNTEYTIEYSELPLAPYIDLGLPSGTLWAEYNVGANSPEEIGDYFAWGETVSKNSYTLENYAWYNTGTSEYTKYTTKGDFLLLEDDAASVNMGGDFHMPTVAQYKELMDYTTPEITTLNNVPGLLVTSKVNGNTLFFPGALVLSGDLQDVTQNYFASALTWTNQTDSVSNGSCFDIYSGAWEIYSVQRYMAMPVRGVIGTLTEYEGGSGGGGGTPN